MWFWRNGSVSSVLAVQLSGTEIVSPVPMKDWEIQHIYEFQHNGYEKQNHADPQASLGKKVVK